MTSRVLAAAFTGLLLAGARLVAHHEILAKFDDHKPVTLNGIVTLVDWRNPHVHVFMNVPDAAGLVNWAIELEGPIDLERSGWSRETLRPGDRVRVVPNHSCVVSNMVDAVYLVDGDRVIETMAVAARGRIT